MSDKFWTMTPNAIYAAMPDMKEAELRITLALVRNTYGHQRNSCVLTYADFAEQMNLTSPTGIRRGIKRVLERGFFVKGDSRSTWIIADAPFGVENDTPEKTTPSVITTGNAEKDTTQSVGKDYTTCSENEINPTLSVMSTSGTKEKERKKEEIDPDPIGVLKEHFCALAGILPGRSNWESDWAEPLRVIYERAGGVGQAKEAISSAVTFARDGPKQYTISSPRSLTTIIANMSPNGAGDPDRIKVSTR